MFIRYYVILVFACGCATLLTPSKYDKGRVPAELVFPQSSAEKLAPNLVEILAYHVIVHGLLARAIQEQPSPNIRN